MSLKFFVNFEVPIPGSEFRKKINADPDLPAGLYKFIFERLMRQTNLHHCVDVLYIVQCAGTVSTCSRIAVKERRYKEYRYMY